MTFKSLISGYFFTFFILYNNFIPISLYVTVEVCNYCQVSSVLPHWYS